MRLSKYLKDKYPNLSARIIKRALEQGACLVNGKIESFGSRVINPKQDRVSFTVVEFTATPKLIVKKSHIVFEDDDLLVYNKEPGHAALATENDDVNLHQELKKSLQCKFLEPAHRLDKNTSGLFVLAKNKKTLQALNQAFQEKTIAKEYLALVDGKWQTAKNQTLHNYLELDFKKGAQQKWRVAKDLKQNQNKTRYKEAITKITVEKTYDKYSLVRVFPQTGRTHQIRVHLASLGHPILGDALYAEKFKSKILVRRHLLHACALQFKHPCTGQILKLKSKPPKDFEDKTTQSSCKDPAE